jgi:hypothetical protein
MIGCGSILSDDCGFGGSRTSDSRVINIDMPNSSGRVGRSVLNPYTGDFWS